MLRSTKELQGYTLGASDGAIGVVREFYFDDDAWIIRYLVAETGSWLMGRQVLIPPRMIETPDDEQRMLPVNLTRKQIENSPSIDTDKPVSRQFEEQYHQYYGWPSYWGVSGLGLAQPNPSVPDYIAPTAPALAAQDALEQLQHQEQQSADPHLRSSAEVEGYHLQANDEGIGHIDDFLIDDTTWAIRYLVIDTRNWWPGKKVLIAPLWIKDISWPERKVYLDLLRQAIEEAPVYDGYAEIDRDYEARLFKHYNQPGHWV